MLLKPGQSFACEFTTESTNGAAVNADSLPTGMLVVNGVDVPGSPVTITSKAVGRYRASANVTAGAAPGDIVQVHVAATIAGVAAHALVLQGTVDGKRLAELQDLSASGAAGAVRTELLVELGRLDAAVSSRAAAADYTPVRGAKLDLLDAAVSSRLAASAFVAPPGTTDIAAAVDGVLTGAHGAGSWQTGSGGSATVQILPLASNVQTQPVSPTLLAGYLRGAATHRIAVFDSQQQPVDLRSKVLEFALETLSGTPQGSVGGVSVAGPDHNELVLAIPAELHAAAGLYRYAVRDLGDGARVWAHGEYLVAPAAGPAATGGGI